MRPRSIPALALVAITLATVAPARADVFDDLLACVPADAALVVGVDHAKLSKHPHYADLIGFMAGQGWVRGLDGVDVLAPGEVVMQSVTFRMPNDVQATVVKGKVAADAVQKHFEATLGAAFKTATHGERTYYSIGDEHVAADLGGGRLVLAPERLIEGVLDTVAGGKPIAKRAGFKALRREASKGKPPVWAVAFVPKRTRDRLDKQGAADMAHVERIAFQAKGRSDMELKLRGYCEDEAGAKAVADGINGKIERKILGSTVLKALGVAALAKRVAVSADKDAVVGALTLTEPQVGLFAKLGGRILQALK